MRSKTRGAEGQTGRATRGEDPAVAEKNPKAGQRRVRLDISVEHRMILRHRIELWLRAEREDLEEHEETDEVRTRVATYERLIEALFVGRITLPDDDARLRLSEALEAFEAGENWEEKKVDRDSLSALIGAMGGRIHLESSARPAEGERSSTTADDLQMESAVLARVLGVHPAHLSEDELVRELAGEAPSFAERDAVCRAAEELSRVGLLHLRDDLISPTRAALRSEALRDR